MTAHYLRSVLTIHRRIYLAGWMRRSGLAELLPSLRAELAYLGVSAGSMAMSSAFSESYTQPPSGNRDALASEHFLFATAEGEVTSLLVTAHGAGWVDFALISHFANPDHPDASVENAEKRAARIALPVYAIDDQTAIAVSHDAVQVVSEGQSRLVFADCVESYGNCRPLRPAGHLFA
jgi:dipeptidase E